MFCEADTFLGHVVVSLPGTFFEQGDSRKRAQQMQQKNYVFLANTAHVNGFKGGKSPGLDTAHT
jgi:hypothetical protein